MPLVSYFFAFNLNKKKIKIIWNNWCSNHHEKNRLIWLFFDLFTSQDCWNCVTSRYVWPSKLECARTQGVRSQRVPGTWKESKKKNIYQEQSCKILVLSGFKYLQLNIYWKSYWSKRLVPFKTESFLDSFAWWHTHFHPKQ